MNNIEIIPAVMPERFSDIEKNVDMVAPFASWVQMDIMDGVFVPATSWPYGNDQWGEVERLAHGELVLPHKGVLHYEAHLMVSDPERIGELLARGGVERIVMHAETLDSIDVSGMSAAWRAAGAKEIGIALLLDTPVSVLIQYIDLIQFVQVMGIEKVGFQGESLSPHVVQKIKSIQNVYPQMRIECDGGVNASNIGDIVAAGVSRIVVGSAIVKAEDPQAAYAALQNTVVEKASS
jgi:ribulose-phosphate 3-epimerase